jgi:O-ureido-D-serine cyclo-ligase
MPRLALATSIAHAGRDLDLAPLIDACARQGLDVAARAWDDASVGWSRFDAVLVRSPWDYAARRDEFLRWGACVAGTTQLINPLAVLAWNTDKHYLGDLARRGVPVVPTRFVAPSEEPLPALREFMAEHSRAAEFVVKPAIGAGSRGAQRFDRAQEFAAANHLGQLLDAGRDAMLQPYLPRVDHEGEHSLVFFDDQCSHAVRRGAQLAREGGTVTHSGHLGLATAAIDEGDLALARRALDAASGCLQLEAPLAYARVDMVRDADGTPCLMELELTEPSLFFAQAPGSADRFAALLARRLAR